MKIFIASILFIIFLLLACIHFYWGLGGKWGTDAATPTKGENKRLINPGLPACFIVAFALLGAGTFCLVKAGIIAYQLPGWLLNNGLWVISALFFLRAIGEFKYVGLFKKINNTKFGKMDTKYYTPLCLFIAVSGTVLQLIN